MGFDSYIAADPASITTGRVVCVTSFEDRTLSDAPPQALDSLACVARGRSSTMSLSMQPSLNLAPLRDRFRRGGEARVPQGGPVRWTGEPRRVLVVRPVHRPNAVRTRHPDVCPRHDHVPGRWRHARPRRGAVTHPARSLLAGDHRAVDIPDRAAAARRGLQRVAGPAQSRALRRLADRGDLLHPAALAGRREVRPGRARLLSTAPR